MLINKIMYQFHRVLNTAEKKQIRQLFYECLRVALITNKSKKILGITS